MPNLSRRKKGLILGLSLMSAAALVAFGTARYATKKKRSDPQADGDDDAVGEDDQFEALDEGPSFWERVKEVGQGAFLLLTNRKLRD